MGTLPYTEVARGKTKIILKYEDPSTTCIVKSLNFITAGNGKRQEEMEGKADLSTRTTCNVFRLLERHRLPIAFIHEAGRDTFLAEYLDMIPLEVVVRSVIGEKSSYRKRKPETPPGHRLSEPIVELYLKTSGKKWKDIDLPDDDPLLEPIDTLDPEKGFSAYSPSAPATDGRKPLIERISLEDLKLKPGHLARIKEIALQAFGVVSKAFEAEGGSLEDFKVEFGYSPKWEEPLLGDVLDNDSWRLRYKGEDVSKQGFRDGEPIAETRRKYLVAAILTDNFREP